MEVAGVDGCKAGWLLVTARGADSLHLLGAAVHESFTGILRATRECEALAVDIPIGLTESGPRAADEYARRVLGRPRASSVFPAPIRPVLGARTYEEACRVSLNAQRKKMSRQSFAILPKILEVDQALTPDLAWQEWVMEVHPEVCFWALNHHEPMRHNKKKPEGAEERTRLLRRVFETDFAPIKAPRGAAQDDLLDACAAAWTAARFARQEHGTLPESPPRDGKGLLMRIVY